MKNKKGQIVMKVVLLVLLVLILGIIVIADKEKRSKHEGKYYSNGEDFCKHYNLTYYSYDIHEQYCYYTFNDTFIKRELEVRDYRYFWK